MKSDRGIENIVISDIKSEEDNAHSEDDGGGGDEDKKDSQNKIFSEPERDSNAEFENTS